MTPKNNFMSDDDHVHEDVKVNIIVSCDGVIKKDDYVDGNEVLFANIMKRIMDPAVNNVSNNIDDVVNDFFQF